MMIFFRIVVFVLLTLLTQVGGVIYLLCIPLYKKVKGWFSGWKRPVANLSFFLGVYLLASFTLIPLLARITGRVPLPLIQEKGVEPLAILTCVMNRHYVRSEVREVLFQCATELRKKHPDAIVSYLDGNFPFVNGFPLLPHWSHNDGKKLDLAFFYTESEKEVNGEALTYLGYGGFEEPRSAEVNTAEQCRKRGAFQYGMTGWFATNRKKGHLKFDEKRTGALIRLLAQKAQVQKIFIEPHLRNRLGLSAVGKVRFHGCHAVRHDDHIHFQLR